MTNHVPTLETCQKLKAAGFPQKTEFFWVITSTTNYHLSWYPDGELPQALLERNDCYAAPLLTEILEQLPEFASVAKRPSSTNGGKQYTAWIQDNQQWHDNPVEAAVLLWLEINKKV